MTETSAFHGGQLPPDTPISQMLSPGNATLLSPAARNLTKADLLALQGPGGATQLHLTFSDLQTDEEAFHQQFPSAPEGPRQFDTSACCCCTPCCSCCCAAAVPSPLIGVA